MSGPKPPLTERDVLAAHVGHQVEVGHPVSPGTTPAVICNTCKAVVWADLIFAELIWADLAWDEMEEGQ